MASITISIPDNRINEFLVPFLTIYPNTSGLSDQAWVKQKIISFLQFTCLRGNREIAENAAVFDNNIVS